MMVLAVGPALVLGLALLVYRRRQSERFFDPHHKQAFEVLVWSLPDNVEISQEKGMANA